ncbi:hypothetical protein NL676_010460 [Syzygium grande]|nr:hypothetical protein NL676_010460 [Syzygium grande]
MQARIWQWPQTGASEKALMRKDFPENLLRRSRGFQENLGDDVESGSYSYVLSVRKKNYDYGVVILLLVSICLLPHSSHGLAFPSLSLSVVSGLVDPSHSRFRSPPAYSQPHWLVSQQEQRHLDTKLAAGLKLSWQKAGVVDEATAMVVVLGRVRSWQSCSSLGPGGRAGAGMMENTG